MSLNGNLESSSIYIAMKSRPSPREYHWGLIVTNNIGRPVLHHATNLTGPWEYEERRNESAIDLTLIVLVKASGVSNLPRATQIIQSVPADGKPSRRTGAAFTCRIWVKDALVELHETGEIFLADDIEVIETEAIAYAESGKDLVTVILHAAGIRGRPSVGSDGFYYWGGMGQYEVTVLVLTMQEKYMAMRCTIMLSHGTKTCDEDSEGAVISLV
ncbi:hypothetical protein DER44DRAFT_879665 [Fusarium oxysporum]|nr:hypothetical protein DER44DRAFT_879665 [Fusarium oxysporum]